MGEALFQIAIMLIGAALIAMLFTWLFWRKKFRHLYDEHQNLQKTYDSLKSNHESLRNQYQELTSKHDKLNSDFENYKSDTQLTIESKDAEIKKTSEERNEYKSKFVREQQAHEDYRKYQEQEISKLNQELSSKERAHLDKEKNLTNQLKETQIELNQISKNMEEIENRPKSYYKIIDGVKYKAATLKMADEAVAGKGDGRISKEDAEKIFASISDGTQYTDIEKGTMKYIRTNYNWTPEADELFRHEVRVWAAKGHHLD